MRILRNLKISFLCVLLVASSAAAISKEVTVPASVPFTSTGIKLKKGQKAILQSGGTISYGSRNPSCRTPKDALGCSAETICPVAGACGALIARVGGRAATLVGLTGEVVGPGLLELGINDIPEAFGDNTGSFNVTITYSSGNVVTGSVFGSCGANIVYDGVRITASQNGARVASTTTDSAGNYSIKFKKKGRYTLKASSRNMEFRPARRMVRLQGEDIPNIHFIDVPQRSEKVTLGELFFTIRGRGTVADGGTVEVCNPSGRNFQLQLPYEYVVDRAGFEPLSLRKGCTKVRLRNPDGNDFLCKDLTFAEETFGAPGGAEFAVTLVGNPLR